MNGSHRHGRRGPAGSGRRLGMGVRPGTAAGGNEPATRRRHAVILAAVCALALAAPVLAANKTWNGGGGDDLWQTGANWGGSAPLANDVLFFGASPRLTPDNDLGVGTQFNGLTFNAGAGAYTLTGNGIVLGGNVANSSTSLQTIGLDLTLNATRTFSTTSGGGDLWVDGDIGETGGAWGVTKSGSGTLTLAGDNSYAGGTSVSSGVLNIRHANALGTTAGGTFISNNAALELQGGLTVAEGITFNGSGISNGGAIRNLSGDNRLTGPIVLGGNNSSIRSDAGTLTIASGINRSSGRELILGGAGNITVEGAIDGDNGFSKDGSGTLTFTAANTFTSSFYISGGTLNVRHAQALGSTSSGTTVADGATLEMQGGITVSGEWLSLNASGLSGNGALRNVSGDNTWDGGINFGSDSPNRVQSDSGTLTITRLITSSNHGSLTFGGEGDTTLSGSIAPQWWRLAVTKEGGGALNLEGANYFTTLPNAASKDGSAILTVNAGTVSVQAGDAVSDAGATAGSGTRVLAVTDSSGLVVGQTAVGSGVAGNSIIAAINGPNQVTLSADTTGAVSGVTFGSWSSLGGAPLVLNGGTLDLNGKSHQSGAVTIGNSSGGAPVVMAGTLAATGDYTAYSGSVLANLGESGGVRTFTKNGAGTVTLSGANTYTGATSVNGGTLALDFSAAGAPTDNIINSATNSSALNLGSTVGWNWSSYWLSGSLEVTGADGAANTQRFNGLTLAQNSFGTVRLDAGGGGTLALNVGALTRNGGSTVDFDLSAGASFATSTGTAGSLLVGGQSQAYATVGGDTWALKDAGNAYVTGAEPGFYTPSTATTLTGHANLTGGDTTLAASTGISTLRLGDDAARTLDLNGKTLTVNNGAILVADTVATAGSRIVGGSLTSGATNNSGRDLIVHQHSEESFEVASAIVNNGSDPIRLYKSGAGELLLSGANAFSGSTTVSGGTLTVGSGAALGSASNTLNITGGASVNLNGFDLTVGSLYGIGAIDNLSGQDVTLTLGAGNGDSTFAGTIQDSAAGTVAVIKTGTGSWTASTTSTYSGGTVLAGGTASPTGSTVTSGGAILNGPFGTGTVTLAGGTLSCGTGFTLAYPIIAQAGTSSALRNEQEMTLTGNISGSGDITSWTGNAKPLHLYGDNSGFSGVWTNSSSNTLDFRSADSGSAAAAWVLDYATTLNFADGTLSLGSLAGTANLNKAGGGGTTTVEVGALGLDGTFSGALGDANGTLAVTKVGAGSQTFSGANTYAGQTTVSDGTLKLGHDAGLGFGGRHAVNVGVGGTQVDGTGIVDLDGRTVNEPITLAGGSLVNNNAAAATLADGLAGIYYTNEGSGYTTTGSGVLSFTGGGGSGASGSYTANYNKVLTLQLTGAGSGYTSAPAITVVGPTGSGANPMAVLSSLTLTGTDNTIGGSGDMTIAAVVSGAGGGFSKTGAGTLTLSAVNTYTGPTAVQGGTVNVAGSLADTTVSVHSGGALGGTGTIAGTVSFGDGGTARPGASVGELTINNTVTFEAGSAYQWELSAGGGDHIQVNGDLAVTGSPVLRLVNLDNTDPTGQTYDIITFTGDLTANAPWTIDYGATATSGTVSNWTDGNSSWDIASNWDQFGWSGGAVSYTDTTVQLSGLVDGYIAPGPDTDVVIAPPNDAAVTGPAAPRSINSLTLGDGSAYDHSLTLQAGGPLTVATTVAVNTSGTLEAAAGGLTAGQVTVTGAAHLANALDIDALNSGGTTQFSAGASGTVGALTVTAGTTTLAGGTTHIAAATVAGGAFVADAGSIGLLTVNSGQTAQFGGTATVDALAGQGTIELQNATTFAVGGAGASSTFEGTLSGSGALAKEGNGILTLAGEGTYTGATDINGGTLRLDVTSVPAYEYYRFTPTKLRGNSIPGIVQLSELEFFFNYSGTDWIHNYTPGATASNVSGSSPGNEGPGMAVDGSTATKWLNFDAGALLLDFPSPVRADKYNWATANDATERDPVSWTIEASNDNLNWSLLDTQTNYATTTSRNTFLPGFTLGAGGGSASTALPSGSPVTIAAGATLDVNNLSATIGSLAGGGTVLLGSGTLSVGQNGASTAFSGSVAGTAASTLGKIGAGELTLTGPVQAGTLDLSAGTTTFGSGATVTADTMDSAASTQIEAGANAAIGTLSVTGGTTTIAAGATATIANASVVAGATLDAAAGAFETLTAAAGTVDLGAGVTLGTATFTGGVGGADVDTHGDTVTVTGSISAVPSAGNAIIATATAGRFGVQGNDLANRLDGIVLDSAGSRVTLSQETSTITAGLDVRAWTVNGNGLDTLEGAPYNLASPAVTPDNTTPGLGGSSSTLSYMTNAIHWNLNDSQEWASNGGLSDPPYPTNYRTTYAVEYRGSIQIPSDGVYRFATSSDDRSALWIDPSSDNPAYAEAIVQNRFDQGVTRRSSGQVSLNAGYHDIIVRFAQGGGGHGLYVEWDPTGGTTFADIPGIRYFHGGIVAGPFNQPATGLTTVATGELTFPAGDNHLGALTLGGDGTELTLSGATTVTFEGDVLGTGTTAVTLNGPALVLAGTSVDAVGAADVLSLPAAGFAASAVSVNAGGAGTVVFTDAMSFSAPGASLTVEGGNLRVDGALDGAAVTVEAGGWLRGTGPIRGLVTVTADAAIAPGDTAGTLTVESTVILEDGAVLAFDLDTPNAAAGAGGNDWLSVTDQLVLSPGVRLAIEPGASFGEGVYHLIGFGSLLDNSGGFHNWGISGADGYGFQFLLQGGSLDLRIFENVIPEPASGLLLVCGALGLLHRRR